MVSEFIYQNDHGFCLDFSTWVGLRDRLEHFKSLVCQNCFTIKFYKIVIFRFSPKHRIGGNKKKKLALLSFECFYMTRKLFYEMSQSGTKTTQIIG